MNSFLPSRQAFLGLFALCFLPAALVFFYFQSLFSDIDSLQTQLDQLKIRISKTQKKELLNNSLKKHYKNNDHSYVETQIESLRFLQREIDEIEEKLKKDPLADHKILHERLSFLQSSANAPVLNEGAVLNLNGFNERVETLNHSIEVDAHDIKVLLNRIEGTSFEMMPQPTNAPQLIFTYFTLEKKERSGGADVFIVNFHLLMRDFL